MSESNGKGAGGKGAGDMREPPRQIGDESDLIGRDVIVTRMDEAVGFFGRMARKLEPATEKAAPAINWGRKYSFFVFPFATACCAMEYMATIAPRYDISRFGAELPRFSPRQADLMIVIGTVTHRNAPIMKRVWEQMCDPKWCISFGVCASSGGFYRNYATLQGIDRVVPVDVFIPGCPPRPEAVLDSLIMLQEKVQQQRAGVF